LRGRQSRHELVEKRLSLTAQVRRRPEPAAARLVRPCQAELQRLDIARAPFVEGTASGKSTAGRCCYCLRKRGRAERRNPRPGQREQTTGSRSFWRPSIATGTRP
jgi:hypothetical protein